MNEFSDWYYIEYNHAGNRFQLEKTEVQFPGNTLPKAIKKYLNEIDKEAILVLNKSDVERLVLQAVNLIGDRFIPEV